MKVLVRVATLCLALCTQVGAQQPGTDFVDLPEPPHFHPDVYEHEGRSYIVARVVDAMTAAPINGATLHLVTEDPQPIGGRFTSERQAISDRDGYVRVRVDDLGTARWSYCFADGYAPWAEMTDSPGTIAMRRGVDVPVILRDAEDRPVADAEVAWVMGCGHTPDVRSVPTDARGHAVIPNVSLENDINDVYVRHPRLAGGYEVVDSWHRGDAPIVLRWQPGKVFSGVLLDAFGKPVVGAAVGSSHCHRGSWSRTGPDGAFRVDGIPLDYDTLEVARAGVRIAEFRRWSWDGQVTLRLREDGTRFEPPTLERVSAVVRVTSGERPVDARVRMMWNCDDGGEDDEVADSDPDGIAELEVPARALRLRVEASPDYEPVERSLDASALEHRIDITLAQRPRVRLRLDGFADPDLQFGMLNVTYRSPRGIESDVTAAVRRDWMAPVAIEGGGAIEVECSGEFGRVAVPQPIDAGVTLAVRPGLRPGSRQTVVRARGRLIGDSTRLIQTTVTLDGELVPVGDDGRYSLLRDESPTELVLEFANTFERRIRLPRLAVPLDPAHELELGERVVRKVPTCRWDEAEPKAAWSIELHRDGIRVGRIESTVDPESGTRSFEQTGDEPRAGDFVVMQFAPDDERLSEAEREESQRTSFVPVRATLIGDAPFTLHTPRGQVDVALEDEDGTPLSGHMLFPGLPEALAIDGDRRFRQVPDGAHRVLVWSPEHLPQHAEFVLEDGASHALRFRLRRQAR